MLTKDNLIALTNLLLLYFCDLPSEYYVHQSVLVLKKSEITRITHILIMLNAVSLCKSPLSKCIIFRFSFI